MDKKILLLDRDNDIMGLAHEIMFYGYSDMHITSDPDAVYKIAKNYRPDLVILDFVLGDENFTSICELFKSNELLKNVPVIVVSKSHNRVIHNDALEEDTVFIKPLDNKDFATQISYHMAS
ncbi:response regulator [Mucilaginibacter polytrichastri]|nr:response regulator [Mucilaginibacter polytrichastri]